VINAELSGDREVIIRFNKIPESVRNRLSKEVERLAIKMVGVVKTDYLSGQSLKVKTGHLRGSINEKTTSTGDSVTAVVGPNMEKAKYAAYHEFGFHGTETVKAHLRTITSVFGRSITPTQIAVRSFSRTIDYNGHPFMRPALDQMKPEILESMKSVIQPALDSTKA
jgi:HK97 gp10 family phage protein